MSTIIWAVLGFIFAGIGLWLISFVVETLRPAPEAPIQLRWASEIPVAYVEVGGNRVRYIKSGAGPTLVLLHTLRTQLDLFEKVVLGLSKRFTVYALDFPGHGYSDIPETRYDATFFTDAIEGFLEKLALQDVTLAGISIGGAISLNVAARQNPRVLRVIAVNPYDYAKGRGMARSSVSGWIITHTSQLPFIGETIMRLRNFIIMKAVLRGGVADAKSISPALMKEMYLVGNRRGHYRAFLSLLRNSVSWELTTTQYRRIKVPVLLIWGHEDWAYQAERQKDESLVPGVRVETVLGGGHFLSLDRPEELQKLILEFAGV